MTRYTIHIVTDVGYCLIGRYDTRAEAEAVAAKLDPEGQPTVEPAPDSPSWRKSAPSLT